MTLNPAEVDKASGDRAGVEEVRGAIENEIGTLRSAVSVAVRAVAKGLNREQLVQRVEEVLNETVCRALERPEPYQPGRPAMPWLIGIARNVLRGEARDDAKKPRQVRQADVDDATWEQLFQTLGSSDGLVSDRMDVEQMLSRLSPSARQAIECRFLKNLEGQELAEALGAPSAGAARVRVARALQALRDLFAADASEVTP